MQRELNFKKCQEKEKKEEENRYSMYAIAQQMISMDGYGLKSTTVGLFVSAQVFSVSKWLGKCKMNIY